MVYLQGVVGFLCLQTSEAVLLLGEFFNIVHGHCHCTLFLLFYSEQCKMLG